MIFKNGLFGLARVRINEVPISEGLLYSTSIRPVKMNCISSIIEINWEEENKLGRRKR